MNKFLLLLLLLSTSAWAGELVSFGSSAPTTLAAVEKMQALLRTGAKDRQEALWNELCAMNPRGLSYVDEVLKNLVYIERGSYADAAEPAGKVLLSLPGALSGIRIGRDFFAGTQRKSIHENGKKILQQLRTPSPARSAIISIFDQLDLWDQSDLGLLTTQYILNRQYSGVLIRILNQSAPVFLHDFVRRIRAEHGRRELVDLLLIYKSGLSSGNELIALLSTLMENYSLTLGVMERQLYGPSNKEVYDLINEVTASLHERIGAQDKRVMKAYSKADVDPSLGERLLSSEQLSKYRRFLWRLKVGDCEPALQVITGSEDRAG